MSKKLPPITGILAPTSPITVPSKAPSNILPEFMPLPTPRSIRQSPILFDHKTSKSNKTKLAPIKNNSSNEKETPRKVINPSLDRSKLARPKTASRDGRRKGGRKTRKETKSQKTRKNRKSKSKRKTRRTRRK